MSNSLRLYVLALITAYTTVVWLHNAEATVFTGHTNDFLLTFCLGSLTFALTAFLNTTTAGMFQLTVRGFLMDSIESIAACMLALLAIAAYWPTAVNADHFFPLLAVGAFNTALFWVFGIMFNVVPARNLRFLPEKMFS